VLCGDGVATTVQAMQRVAVHRQGKEERQLASCGKPDQRRGIMRSVVNKRIVEKVIDFWKGKDIKDWLERVGLKVVEDRGDVLVIQGQVRTALNRNNDPVTIFICLVFALFGAFWIFVCRDGLVEIREYWKKHI